MSTHNQVTADEAEAIQALVRPAVESEARISLRDFKAPRRLHQSQLDSLARQADKVMVDASAHLSSWLRSPHRTRVADVVESHVGVLIEGLVEPMHVLAFDVGSQLGFVAWELSAMTAAIETALGSPDTRLSTPRSLSSAEERILKDLLSRVAAVTATALGVEARNFRVMREKKELVLAEDATTSDAQRIGVHVAIEGAAGESTLRIYVPGVKAPDVHHPGGSAKDAKKNTMPPQFAVIDVELRAELGTVAVPLQELMSLEVGDVIVLDTKVGDMVALTAEGEVRAHGELGRRDDKLAVCLRSINRASARSGDVK